MKNSTNRLLSVAVILLLIANIALVTVLVLSKNKDAKPGPRESGKAAFEKFVKDLNLNEAQKKQYDSLRDAHMARIRPLFDTIRMSRQALFSMMKDENINDSMVKFYTGRIADKQTQADTLTLNHFHLVRTLFNGEQQKKYDDFVQKMMQRPRKDSAAKKKE